MAVIKVKNGELNRKRTDPVFICKLFRFSLSYFANHGACILLISIINAALAITYLTFTSTNSISKSLNLPYG